MRIAAGREFGLEALVSLAIVEPRDADQAFGCRLSAAGLPCRLPCRRYNRGVIPKARVLW
jgi:hypothetical protein